MIAVHVRDVDLVDLLRLVSGRLQVCDETAKRRAEQRPRTRIDHHEPEVQQAAEWLRMVQNPDGGWGETCGSYDDPNTKGIGPSTPSQTAWAVMGLLAAQDTRSESVAKGIAYILKTQKKDGTWDEPWYTGTGFPRVFYLMYHLYRQYFPLLALTTYKKVMGAKG